MLRCRIAAKEVCRSDVIHFAHVSLAFPSSQGSCSYKTHRSYSRRIRRKPSQLEISERQTLQDIRKLKADLDSSQKVKEAQDTQAKLGEVSENMLDRIYDALQAPDPPLEEEIRLEARRERKRQDKLVEGKTLNFIDTVHGQKVVQRLARLSDRLDRYQLGFKEVHESTSAYNRTCFLLGLHGIVEGVEEEKQDDATAETLKFVNDSKDVERGLLAFTSEARRNTILDQIEIISVTLANRPSGSQITEVSTIPLGMATSQEWEALVTSFAYHNDIDRVIRSLKAAQQSGHFLSLSKAANAALDIYANQGATSACQKLIDWMEHNKVDSDDYTSHCLVKSCTRGNRFKEAFDILGKLEDEKPASLGTYTLVMTALMQQKGNPSLQQMIWPLFNRMRLVAHPIPDAPCYAMMIKACAMGITQSSDTLWKPRNKLLPNDDLDLISNRSNKAEADAERALDLFREMTSRYGIRPNVEVYSALILTCAKRKDMYEKALQLFRNMIELEQARVQSKSDKLDGDVDSPSYAPTREVFNAVLSGCAKNADLLRARWILAEMLRSAAIRWQEIMSQKGEGAILTDWEVQAFEDRLPNTETLSKLFYTYASYRPPRLHFPSSNLSSTASTTGEGLASRKESTTPEQDVVKLEHDDNVESALTYNIPQTRRALIREVKALMERIKVDYKAQNGLLSIIVPDSVLLNSYISVLSIHSDKTDILEEIESIIFGRHTDKDKEESLFETFNVTLNGYTCEAALEACSKMNRSEQGYSLASRIWAEWIALGGTQSIALMEATNRAKIGLTNSTISQVWSFMIKIQSKNNRLDEAMALLRDFARLHPPQEVAAKSTAIFTSARALTLPIQDSASSTMPGPILTFKQIEALHLRLIEVGNSREDIRFVTWLLKAYDYHSRPKKPTIFKNIPIPISRQEAMRRILLEQR